MKHSLLEKTSELAQLIKKHSDSDAGVTKLDIFEENVRLLPDRDISTTDKEQFSSLLDQATSLELAFEDAHPHISETMREIIKILSDIGI